MNGIAESEKLLCRVSAHLWQKVDKSYLVLCKFCYFYGDNLIMIDTVSQRKEEEKYIVEKFNGWLSMSFTTVLY
jgi:hypothetical protein